MGKPGRTEQILDIKERSLRTHRFLSYQIHSLQWQWSKARSSPDSTPDFYIIKIVTLLEVFTRRNLAELIDHGPQYTDRAVELSKHFKMDFALVRGVQGRVITLGDIVSHSVPVNSFGQILGHFEIVVGVPLQPLLSKAIDRWATEAEKLPPEPIIPDFEAMANRLSRLFEVRNILCHELPKKAVYESIDVDDFLDAAFRFTKAMQEVLTFEMFGLVPLTQTDMNIAAGESLKKAESQMNQLLSEAREHIGRFENEHPPDDCESWLHSLNDAQEKWLVARNALCDFETHLNRGGTIRGLLWANEAQRLTNARTHDIQAWLEREREK